MPIFPRAFALSLLSFYSITLPNYLSAQDTNSASQTSGDMVFFPGLFQPLVSITNTDTNAGAPGSSAGWHLPGMNYRAGSGWWALVCDATEKISDAKKTCQLHASKLSVSRAKHGVYDGEPIPSQLLWWSPLPASLDKVPLENEQRPKLIAMFKPIRSLAKLNLQAGVIPSYVYQGMQTYPRTPRSGTLEVRITLSDGAFMDVVPRVKRSVNTENKDWASQNDITQFELRMGSRRQSLPGYSFSEIDGPPSIKAQDYLVWVGDLDGDGKPDLIINHGGYGTHFAMYLSSLAKEGELVGLAGQFDFDDPSSAGC